MNTKLLMMITALLMAICGIFFQFVPNSILNYFNADPTGISALFVQMIGALYLGFAMMNWMAKAVLIGGIYARPLAMGNFVHFMIGALALGKFGFGAQSSLLIWIAAMIYALFASAFAVVMFTHPQKAGKDAKA